MLAPKSSRAPSYLQTQTLEDSVQRSSRPARFIMLLAIPEQDRQAVEREALFMMFRLGGSYTEKLLVAVTRYNKTNNRKDTS